MRCKDWDCGWCYNEKPNNANDEAGACNNPKECKAHAVQVTSIEDFQRKKAIAEIHERADKLDW